MGIKPLHYTYVNETLFFSSELLTLTKIPGFIKKINLNAISSYLSFRYPVDNDNLFFKNIFRIKNGSYLKFNLNKSEKLFKTYWKIPEINNQENFEYSERVLSDFNLASHINNCSTSSRESILRIKSDTKKYKPKYFLEISSSVGFLSLRANKNLYPDAIVIGVEPERRC